MKTLLTFCLLGMILLAGCSESPVTPPVPLPNCFFRADVYYSKSGETAHWYITNPDYLKLYNNLYSTGSYIQVSDPTLVTIRFNQNRDFIPTGEIPVYDCTFSTGLMSWYNQDDFLNESVVITANTPKYIEGSFRSLTFNSSISTYEVEMRNGKFLIWK
ncbi:MAG: hypothetical protein U0Y96_12730 [Candidatus Kapaibacterium sp.]